MLDEARQRAWETYRSLPFPSTQDEAWRRTSLRDLDTRALKLTNGRVSSPGTAELPGELLHPIAGKEAGGSAVLGPEGVSVFLDEDLVERGVLFMDLDTAARDHPGLVKNILGQVVSPEDGKFAALTAAYARKGLFVYVPENVRLDKALHSLTWAAGEGQAHFTQLLIYLEDGSSLTYLHETSSPPGAKRQSLLGENVEVLVGKNARLQLIELGTVDDQAWSMAHKKAVLSRDAHLDWVIAALGSKLTKHFISVDMEEAGAEGRVSALFFGDEGQHLSFNTRQNHLAPHTNSDLLFKGGLSGNSRSVWRGMIYVAPGAKNIDGYQANRNMVLSDQARSDSIPGLEILNNDVRCTHGSTVGKIDQEQLFYLQARGIPRPEAEQLILQGFFEVIFGRIPYHGIQERLWEDIRSKL